MGIPLLLLAFSFGAVVGSFLNVCIVRLPLRQSISGRSYCRSCEAPIPFYDNIPLFSYLFLRGHCRSCGAPFSFRYFLVELLTALLAVALIFRLGLGYPFLLNFVYGAFLVAIAFIDLEKGIVPDRLSLPGVVLGLGASAVTWRLTPPVSAGLPLPLESLLGVILGGGSLFLVAWGYERLRGREGLGGGDIKLMAMIGAFWGWSAVPGTLFLASLMGSVVGLGLMVGKGVGSQYALPFAPFLCMGALLELFFRSYFSILFQGFFGM